MASIFKKRILQERLEKFSVPNMEGKLAIIQKWLQAYKDGHLQKKGEKEVEQEFIQHIFVEVLDHNRFPDSPYTVYSQAKTLTSGQKPDAILGYFENEKEAEKVAVVCEIKDCNTPLDKSQRREGNLTPIQQAFKYRTQYKSCDFVLATNFFEIRLLKDNELNFDKWTLETLVDPTNNYFEFKKFYYLLCQKNLVAERGKSITLKLLSDIQIEQEAITKEFYQLYKELRQKLIKNILAKNGTGVTKANFYSLIVEKAQKIIDRIVFVAFCEDLGLLPENILQKVIESDSETFSSTWDTIKGFFKAVDVGSAKLGNTDGYNGELFKPDEDLDKLVIDDDICNEFLKIGQYDFSEDLSVNILGHIFEQSISDLEKLKSIGEEETTDSTSKRKKDGIFYTPEYIVDYIVQNSVGAWLKEQEKNILEKHGVKEDLKDKNYEKRHHEAYEEYQTVLQAIKVLDPACGSGAFLVKVFDYLLEENKRVVDVLAEAQGGAITFFDTERTFKEILQNNIYGVDLNPESVEITKLSLWLKTAQKGKKLTTLKNNIKCGNSLIDDPTVAGDRAFKWEEEFKEIMDRDGFDVIVMNPPYVDSESMTKSIPEQRDYISDRYKTAKGNWDLYIPFIEKATNLLNKNGFCSFISPDKWIAKPFGQAIRKEVLPLISDITVAGREVFEEAKVDSIIMTLSKKSCKNVTILIVNDDRFETLNVVSKTTLKEPYSLDHLFSKNLPLITKIEAQKKRLKSLAECESACATSDAYKLKPFIKDSPILSNSTLKIVNTGTISKYCSRWGATPMTYLGDKYLNPNIEKDTFAKEFGNSYYRKSIKPKIIIKGLTLLDACEDFEAQTVAGKSTLIIASDNIKYLHFLLVFLNSSLPIFYIKNKYSAASYNGGISFTKDMINNLPVWELSDTQIEKFGSLSKGIIEKTQAMKKASSNFQQVLCAELNLENWPSSLETFWSLDFTSFLKKLHQEKLSLSQKDQIFQLWDKYVPLLQSINAEIVELEENANEIIFDQYDLTKAERAVILGTTPANA